MDDHDEKNVSDQQIETNTNSAALFGDKETSTLKTKGKKNQPVVKKSSTSKLKTKIKVSIDLCVPFQTTERNSTAFEKKQNKTNKSPKNRRLPVNRKVSTTTNL